MLAYTTKIVGSTYTYLSICTNNFHKYNSALFVKYINHENYQLYTLCIICAAKVSRTKILSTRGKNPKTFGECIAFNARNSKLSSSFEISALNITVTDTQEPKNYLYLEWA